MKRTTAAHLAALPSTLTLTGSVASSSGAAVANAPVYVTSNQTAATQTAADGTFSLELDAPTLQLLEGEGEGASSNAISLYAVDPSNPNLQGVSAAVDLAERGSDAIGTITLQQAGTITGVILQIAPGQQVTSPAVGVTITAGHSTATSSAGGTFTMTCVPGSVPLNASLPGTTPINQAVSLRSAQLLTLPSPLVLFPLSGVYGVVVPDPSVNIAQLVAQGTPFMRSFLPTASSSAQYIRYSSDATQITASGAGGAAWQPLTPSFQYNFSKDGGNVLYYQFADAAQKNFSPVSTLFAVLDEFADSAGLVLGDGSGQLTSDLVPISVSVPAAAYRMRIANSFATGAVPDMTTAAWREPQANFNYSLSLQRDPSNNQLIGFGNFVVYLQFEDAGGLVSPLYTATATLNLFPPQTSSTVFTVDNGATVTSTRLVTVSINLPPNAYEMLLYEADTTSNVNVLFPAPTDSTTPNTRAIWLTASPVTFYRFTSVGNKILYLQFRTVDQAVGPVYSYPILVNPFNDPTLGGFTMNGGAPTALSPYLNIALTIPPTTTSFRIFESSDIVVTNGANNTTNVTQTFSADIATTTPFLDPTPNFIYTAHEAFGVTTVYVQFQNADNDLSQVYQQTINIEPQPTGSGQLLINPDPITGLPAQATTNPTVALYITPPPGYTTDAAMTIYEGFIADGALTNFISVPTPDPTTGLLDPIPYTVSGVGAHTIYVRFKTTDQAGTITLSPAALAATIFYEPFPEALDSVVINGGAATVSVANAGNATLTLNAPNNVTQMRLVNDSTPALTALPFQAFQPTVTNYALPLTPGFHVVYVQYQNANGDISTIYSSSIEVTP